MSAYYNEIDPFAAEWLRNLIKAGHIADGVVDERSISDIRPSDLAGYTQCHFFAGIGVWSLALRNAGWSDERPIWTGSCPCQPFSSAGKGSGFDDERHLWPAFEWLIRECRPATVIGEQVASKDAEPWVDLVQADMEALGYTFGAVPFPSASIGAPHIRDRIYWMADSTGDGLQRRRAGKASDGRDAPWLEPERLRHAGGLADSNEHGRDTPSLDRGHHTEHHAQPCGEPCGLADADRGQRDGLSVFGGNERVGQDAGRPQERGEPQPRGDLCERPGPTNGFWRDADWLLCRDGKWRPVEPGTFPLAHGVASRVGRLRAYGNAINAEQARIFIEAVMECLPKC